MRSYKGRKLEKCNLTSEVKSGGVSVYVRVMKGRGT